MSIKQPSVLPGFGLYRHALRATSYGLREDANPVAVAALRADRERLDL